MFARENRQDVAVIRMAHGKVNAMDTPFCSALAQEIEELRSSPLRAAIITGTGDTFSAGVDLKQFLNYSDEEALAFFKALDRLWLACLTLPRPIVAAVNGHALAGGCILAAACDYRITSTTAGRLGAPELAVGVPFPALPWEIASARVAPGVHRRLVLLGQTFSASEALDAGLTEELAEPGDLLERAIGAAARLSGIPATSFRIAKEMQNRRILERARSSAGLDADALAAWRSPEVRASIARYLAALSQRTDRARGTGG